jgi:hypothetical protein
MGKPGGTISEDTKRSNRHAEPCPLLSNYRHPEWLTSLAQRSW